MRRLVPYLIQTRWKICYEVVPVVKCAENISETGSEEYRTLVLTLIKMSVSSAQCILGAVSQANRK